MKTKLLHSFRIFFEYTSSNILFSSLFYSIWLVYTLVSNQSFELSSFPQRMIGTATLDGYDVALRVSLFYKSLFLFIFSFSIFYIIGFFLNRKNSILMKSVEVNLINISSLIGIILFVFKVFEYEVFYSMELVYYVHKLMLLGLFLRLVFFKTAKLSVDHYAFIFLLSFSSYFFVADCFNLCGAIYNPDFFIVTFLHSAFFLLLILLLSQKLSVINSQIRITKLIYTLVPLTFFPFISVLKDEMYFILRSHGVLLNDAFYPFIFICVLLTSYLFYRNLRFKNKIQINQKEILTYRYFPIFIFSLIAFIYYSHFFLFSDEAFESGNKYLPVMEFNLFGVIPTLEKFNSHLLSDYFFSAIYAFFNNMGTLNEMELYDFMYIPFSFTFFYFLIYSITRNAYIAVFTILLFPFYASMLPGGYSYCIPGVFALHLVLSRGQSLKNYLVFFIIIFAMTVWRFDLGYSCMITMPVVLVSYSVLDSHFKIKWGLLFKSLSIVLGVFILFILVLSVIRNVNLFAKSIYTLNYFSSAQTFGYSTIGWQNLPSYKMHYFVFPIVVVIIIIALLLNFKTLTISKKQRLAYISLFFLCVFYFVNFNRGLIRHSLIEWTDEFTASFIYIILPGTIFIFFHRQKTLFKFILFCMVTFFSILFFKLPLTTGSVSLGEIAIRKIQSQANDTLNIIRTRVKEAPTPQKHKNRDIVQFIQNNTGSNETFIDFTASSLLYFETKKITPSFFYQNPLCSHNEFLQKHFLEDLKNYNAPYLLFSDLKNGDIAIIDGVPNTLRYYRMAEYFFQNYEPYRIIGYLRIWKKIGQLDASVNKPIFQFKANNTLNVQKQKVTVHKNNSKKYLLALDLKKDTTFKLKLVHLKDTIYTDLLKVSSLKGYCMIDTSWADFDFVLRGTIEFCDSISLLECEHFPDFYSEKYLNYNFKKLPFIWGNYDTELLNEPTLFEQSFRIEMQKDSLYKINIPARIDKSSGNTVVMSCLNKSKVSQNMVLSFGNTQNSDRSRIAFTIEPSLLIKDYAIRVSSLYKWYDTTVDVINLQTDSINTIELHKIKIRKGL